MQVRNQSSLCHISSPYVRSHSHRCDKEHYPLGRETIYQYLCAIYHTREESVLPNSRHICPDRYSQLTSLMGQVHFAPKQPYTITDPLPNLWVCNMYCSRYLSPSFRITLMLSSLPMTINLDSSDQTTDLY